MGNSKEFDMVSELMKDLNKRTEGLNKMIESKLGMLPKTGIKQVELNGKKASILQTINNRIIIEFDNEADANEYFNNAK